jgi:hypothetical protein
MLGEFRVIPRAVRAVAAAVHQRYLGKGGRAEMVALLDRVQHRPAMAQVAVVQAD